MLGKHGMFGVGRSLRRYLAPLPPGGMVSMGLVAFLVALLAFLLVGCGSSDAATTEGVSISSTSSSVEEAGFSGVTLDGAEVSLSQYRGQPLVLVFMATW